MCECIWVSVLVSLPVSQPVSMHVCVRVCVCACFGQSVKVGLAWSYDITRLRGLLASQAAPPPSSLALTSITPSQSYRGILLSLSFYPQHSVSSQNKEFEAREQRGGEFWKCVYFQWVYVDCVCEAISV